MAATAPMRTTPHLALVTSTPRPRGLGYRWFKICELAGDTRWRLLCAVVPRVTTRSMRRRAWEAGFARGLGDRSRCPLLGVLDEFTDGNEYAWELRGGDARLGRVLVALPGADVNREHC
jgi:hypothetical protein